VKNGVSIKEMMISLNENVGIKFKKEKEKI